MKLAYAVLCISFTSSMVAQSTAKRAVNVNEYAKSAGDSPGNPGPIGKLSGELRSSDIQTAIRRVADWQYGRIRNAPSRDWTFAPLYDGFLAASRRLHDPKYHDLVVGVGEHFQWTIGTGDLTSNANEHALGFAYVQLYDETHDANRIADIKREFKDTKDIPSSPEGRPIWWWCDALFMAPPTWSALSAATHDPRYLDYMDTRYRETDRLLWNQRYHLYSRDESFLSKTEANGKPIFWSRGNGWVLAGLAMTLENIPATDPRRAFYLQRFQEMSAEVLSIQGEDGSWRTGLLDAAAYKLPEVSGSAFFLYALAWGVNHDLLPASTYRPAIERGWAVLVAHIYANGRLGAIQPVGDSPGKYAASASYVYGVGAFLLAGSEVDILSSRE